MKTFKLLLTREYIVHVNAENEDAASKLAEYYVSGGLDNSSEKNRAEKNFEFLEIEPVLNEARLLEEMQIEESK